MDLRGYSNENLRFWVDNKGDKCRILLKNPLKVIDEIGTIGQDMSKWQ